MSSISMDKKDEIVMKLVHFLVTKENYTPIVVNGVRNEVWLENVEGPYKIVRINSNYIHNKEQFNFDIYKTNNVARQIKKKTLSWKMNVLNIFLDLNDDVKLDNVEFIDNIKVSDTENGLSKIKCANGNVIECYGTKQEKAIDYTIQIGTEYKFKIISSSGTEQDETVLIDTYWHKITKNIAEGAKIDNPAIKAEYNKKYQANITTKDVLAEDGTVRTDAFYVIDSIVVKMGEQEVTTSGNNTVDKATGKIYIEKVTGDIEINITVKKLEIQTTEAYIGPSSTETNSTKSVENNSQPKGTELYINFKATFGETNCTIKLTFA